MEHGLYINLPNCPYCGSATPTVEAVKIGSSIVNFTTFSHDHRDPRNWGVYSCKICGGVILATANTRRLPNGQILGAAIYNILPEQRLIQAEIPDRPRYYLDEAIRALATPSAALMVCASAVDAMLKERRLVEGSLYARIDKAAKDHIITDDMAKWAHHVRLEANGQRHADEEFALPTKEDAERSLEFALALAEFLFVLPARVTRGLKAASPQEK